MSTRDILQAAAGLGGVPDLKLYAWGENTDGQLGDNTVVSKSSPVQIGNLSNWSQVATGTYFSLALKKDGTIWAWGSNVFGQLGKNNTTDMSSPVQVGTSSNWTYIAAGQYSSFAINSNGNLYAWGRNANGVLGLGDVVHRSLPTQVAPFTIPTGWTTVYSADSDTWATNGTAVYMWGAGPSTIVANVNGVLPRSSPVSISDLNANDIVVGGGYNIVLRTNGTLWSWGQSNTFGQQGRSDTVPASSPIQIGAGTNWSQIEIIVPGCLALKTDGTMWAWSRNISGDSGTNNTISQSSPVQIGALTTWSKIARGGYAIKTDGTLWVWGSGNLGRLGLNSQSNVSSPVQLGALATWYEIPRNSVNTNFMLALST